MKFFRVMEDDLRYHQHHHESYCKMRERVKMETFPTKYGNNYESLAYNWLAAYAINYY